MARRTGSHLCSFQGLLILMPMRKTTNSPSIFTDIREAITFATDLLWVVSSNLRPDTLRNSTRPGSFGLESAALENYTMLARLWVAGSVLIQDTPASFGPSLRESTHPSTLA